MRAAFPANPTLIVLTVPALFNIHQSISMIDKYIAEECG
jgi:hypothetical protein